MKDYTQISKYCFGDWYFEGEVNGHRTKIVICINSEKLIINWYIAGIYKEGKELSSNAHWYGEYLCFTEGQNYFVSNADELTLNFGEFSQPGVVGMVKWEHIFKRMGR